MRTSVNSYEELSEHEKKLAVAMLRSLLTACRDDESGYSQAALDVNDLSLQPVFEELGRRRGAFATQLQTILESYGHATIGEESLTGKLHRRWLDVRSALEPKNAVAMLAECERGEWSASTKYEAALDKVRWPLGTEMILIDHLAAMREARATLDRMRS